MNTRDYFKPIDIMKVIICLTPGLMALAAIGPLEQAITVGAEAINKVAKLAYEDQGELLNQGKQLTSI